MRLGPCCELVRHQAFTQRPDDRNVSPLSILGQDNLVFLRVIAALKVNHSTGKVYVLPTKSHELTRSKARVHGGSPQRPIRL